MSDREYAADSTPEEDFKKTIAAAEDQVRAGGGAFPLPWQALDIINEDQQYKDPISADRWLSLVQKGGKEDYFSSDLSDDELAEVFAGLRISKKPIMFLMSGKDECVPKHVDIPALAKRFVKVTSGEGSRVRAEIVQGAGHSVEGDEAGKDLIRYVLDFIKEIP